MTIDASLPTLEPHTQQFVDKLAGAPPIYARHSVDAGLDRTLQAIADTLAAVAKEATAPSAEER